MIKDFEIYHGIILSRIVHSFKSTTITSEINSDNSSYALNENFGLYIKFSKKRIAPWQFTFTYDHFNSMLNLKSKFADGAIALVCGFDGVCCLTFEEFFKLINSIDSDTVKTISVSRLRNQKYQVSGSDGSLKYKISDFDIQLPK